MNEVMVAHWGVLRYAESLQRQLELWQRRVEGKAPDTIVEVEHPPTITLGRSAPESDIVLPTQELDRRGIDVVRSDRGGRATVHGPGQVVVYPIVGITERGLGVRNWVCELEAALIEVLQEVHIEGRRIEGKPGIWTAQGKIASLGLRVSRGVSYHGVSLNVGLDAGPFDCILPCGVAGERITSIEQESDRKADRQKIAATLCQAIARKIESH